MIKIRLSRGGKRNMPFYRIVAIEIKRKTTGRLLQIIGTWDPIKNDIKYDKNLLKVWQEKGAVISESVKKIIKQ